MKCSCCDREMDSKEIQWNPEIIQHGNEEPGMFDFCGSCLMTAMEAAYSDEFSQCREDEDDIYIVDEDFDEGYVDVLIPKDWTKSESYE
jgi:hypothetical protein